MTQYDPAILQKYADRLYVQANTIILIWSAAGILVGGLAGYFLGGSTMSNSTAMIFWIAIGGVLGFAFGRERAFGLKLRAQTTLCQVKIEENTRAHP